MNTIDAHVHVWTPDRGHYPLAAGFTPADMQPPSFTPEQLFAHAKPAGVNRVVLIQMSFYGFDNSYMLDSIHRFPEVFRGVAVIDHMAPNPKAEMVRLRSRGVRGFRIRPAQSPAGDWLAAPGYKQMFAGAADHRMAICPLINPDALAALDRMCAQFPRTTVVIDHICRIGADGTIRDTDVERLCAMARHPNVFVKISAFYALGKKKPPHEDLHELIRRVHAAFGAQRLMWASDCPFAVDNEAYAEGLELVRDRLKFLSADDKAWILRRTAEHVFFDRG